MRDGPRRFTQDFSCPALLRFRLTSRPRLRVHGCHVLRQGFPAPSTVGRATSGAGPTTPGGASPHPRFGLLRVRSPLLAESLLFSFPAGTEMFQFPAFAPAQQVAGSLPPGFPIRTSAHHGAFATPRGFSQLVTSFFASESHRHPPCALFAFLFSFAFFRLCARLSPRRESSRGLLACSIALVRPPPLFRGGSRLSLRFHHVNDLCSCGE